MRETTYRDRGWVLVGIGAVSLATGISIALLGPVEMYCFYLFSEAGPFHYEGFGFGSFMFGNIAAQIVGYYLIATLLVLLGYRHLQVRRWARTLALTLLWSWVALGIPLSVAFLFVLFTAKDLSLPIAIGATILAGACYLVVPGASIRFYSGRNVRLSFEARDPNAYWVDRRPLPILVLSFLYALYVVCLHIPIFYRGIFPFFGTYLFDLQGIVVLDISMALLVLLIFGTLRQKRWAWWGGLVVLTLASISTISTLASTDYLDVLSKMHFAPIEMNALQGLPFQGIHFAVLIGIPQLMTLGAVGLSRKHFGPKARAWTVSRHQIADPVQ